LIYQRPRKLAYVPGASQRLSRYSDHHNLTFQLSLVQPGDWELESGYAAAKNFLKLPERTTAIFAANDLMALGAIYAVQDAGLKVPEDVAVVGYDNRNFTKSVRPIGQHRRNHSGVDQHIDTFYSVGAGLIYQTGTL
jgi:DNA-binding LacI/PurR family transcriptional regulator